MSLPRRYEACLCALFAAAAAACSDEPPQIVDVGYGGDAFPDRHAAIDGQGRRLAYVPNRRSDSVSVLDLNEMAVVATLPIGRDPVDIDGPRHLVLDPSRELAYVVLSYPESTPGAHEAAQGVSARAGYVEALRVSDLSIAGDLRVDSYSTEVAISSATGLLVVAHSDQNLASFNPDPVARRTNVVMIDSPSAIETGTAKERRSLVCAAPSSLAFNADGSRLFVGCIGEDTVAVVDTDSGEVLSQVPSGTSPANRPYAVVADAMRERLLVSNQVSNVVNVFDMADEPQPVASLLSTSRPMFAAWLSDTTVAVPHQEPDGVSLFDVETSELLLDVSYTEQTCKFPSELTFSSDGRLLLVCEGNHYAPGAVVELDPQTLEIQSRVEVGLYPERLTLLEP